MTSGSGTELVAGILAGDRRAVARAATLIENGAGGEWVAALEAAAGRAMVIGLTGPPGAGKSTFTEQLIRVIRAEGKTVAVVAVDPSSHRTGGALLGDRIRMQEHAGDAGVFIRSMATRGEIGGLAPASRRMAKLFDAAGYDVVLLETVGVGQDEIEVARLAPCVVLLLVPGQGDEVQALKAGVMEIADVFVINKADLAGAEKLYQEVAHEAPEGTPVIKTVAARGEGISEVWAALQQRWAGGKATPKLAAAAGAFAIDHLGIAVEKIDAALEFWEKVLGMSVAHRETVAAEKVHTAMLPAGESRLELLEPSDPESTIGKYLAKRGPGLHHVAIRVKDLEATAQRLAAGGARVLNEARIGAGGHRYVFVHPASTGGVLLELIEERC